MRVALVVIILVMLTLVAAELSAWGSEKLGYVEMSERRGGALRRSLRQRRRIARWGLAVLAIPAVTLIVLINV